LGVRLRRVRARSQGKSAHEAASAAHATRSGGQPSVV